MGEYDITTGHLFRLFPDNFIEFTTHDAEYIEIAETTLKQIRYADAVAWAEVRPRTGEPIKIITHIEFQTDADAEMPFRMAGYIGRLIDMYKAPVYSSVIYLRPQEITDPGVHQYEYPTRFRAEYKVIKIWELDGDEFLRKRILGLLPFAPLMQKPESDNDEQWLRKCVQVIEASARNEQERKELLANMSVLSGLVYDSSFVKTFIREEIMRESSIVKELFSEELFQKYAQYVLFALEAKLGTLDNQTKERISAIQDEELLDHLHRQAVVAEKSEVEREVRLLCT